MKSKTKKKKQRSKPEYLTDHTYLPPLTASYRVRNEEEMKARILEADRRLLSCLEDEFKSHCELVDWFSRRQNSRFNNERNSIYFRTLFVIRKQRDETHDQITKLKNKYKCFMSKKTEIKTYVFVGDALKITGIKCLDCGLTSHNPNDIKEKYCGNCHMFHENPYMKDKEEEDESKH